MQSSCEASPPSRYLNTNGEIVLLDPLEVQRLVDLDVRVGPAVLLPLLEVEGVVLVGLVCRPSNQLVENGGIVLNP